MNSGNESPPLPRVCFLLESYHPVMGGMETGARNLARRLAERGLRVFIMTRRTGRDLPRDETIDGLRVCRIPPSGRGSYSRWWMALTCLPELIRRRAEYDILFVPGFRTLGIPAVFLGRRLDKPCVLKADSRGEMSGEFFDAGIRALRVPPLAALARALIAWRRKRLVRADAYVSMSSELTEELASAGVAREKIRLIPQAVDTEVFQPVSPSEKTALRRKLGLPEDGGLAIFTGRLVSYKGLPVLLRAWREICRARADWRLAIVGAGGADVFNCEDDLKRFVRENRIEDKVLFTGAVENVDEYLKSADLFAFPTENEAFGISLIEAMACGLPAVTTSVGGIRDILENGVDGLTIEAGNAEQLRSALAGLMDSPDRRADIGRCAREKVLARYTWDRIVQAHVDLFQGLK